MYPAVRCDKEVGGQPEPAVGLPGGGRALPAAQHPPGAAQHGGQDRQPGPGVQQGPGGRLDAELPVEAQARVRDQRERQPGTVFTQLVFDGTRRVIALRALLAYAVGAIQLEHLGPLSGAGTTAMAALSPVTFPHLTATAAEARRLEPDAEFGGGLDLLLRGIDDR